MILVEKRRGCKIVITGPDAEGKNTTRNLLVSDATIDQVLLVIQKAIHAESIRQLLLTRETEGERNAE